MPAAPIDFGSFTARERHYALEVFHPDRDPLFYELVANRAPFRDGVCAIPSGPGWGLELNREVIKKFAAGSVVVK